MSVHPVSLSRDDQEALAVLSKKYPDVAAVAQARVAAIVEAPRRPTLLSQMSAEDWAAYDERDMDLTVEEKESLFEDDCA